MWLCITQIIIIVLLYYVIMCPLSLCILNSLTHMTIIIIIIEGNLEPCTHCFILMA